MQFIKVNNMKIFKPTLTAVVYLLIGILEVYAFYLFRCEAIGVFAFFTLIGFIATYIISLGDDY